MFYQIEGAAQNELEQREWFRERFVIWLKQVLRGDIPDDELDLMIEVINELKSR